MHPRVRPAEQRDRLGLLWRLASRCRLRVRVHRREAPLPQAARRGRHAGHARVGRRPDGVPAARTGVQQVKDVGRRARMGPEGQAATITAQRAQAAATSQPATSHVDLVATALGGGKRRRSPTASSAPGGGRRARQEHARPARQRVLEAEGAASATPPIRAGGKVKIEGVGTQLRRRRTVIARSTHVYPRRQRATRPHFKISGRSARTLLDLLTPRPSTALGELARRRRRDQQQRPRRAWAACA